jgi:hypothetical protein
MGRRNIALAVIASVFVLAGLAAAYVKLQLADPEMFADRSVDALQSDAVRAVIAEQITVDLLERRSPELVASRPLVLVAVEAVLETDEFARVLRRTAATAHRVLFEDDRDVIVELEQARDLLVPTIRSAAPELADRLPAELRPEIAAIRGSDAATWTLRVADGADALAWPLLIAGLGLLGLAVWRAPDRRRAAAGGGLILASGAGVGLIAMAALREQVVSHAGRVGVLSDDDARAAAGATWDALAGGLEDWLVITATGGFAVAAGAVLSLARLDRAAALRQLADLLAGGRLPRAISFLRGIAVASLGALILLRAEPVLAAAIVVLGGALALIGVAEALSATARGLPRERVTSPHRRRALVAVVAGGTIAVGLIAVALLGRDGTPARPEEDEILACNGTPANCDRRLDEVVLAGTHNSMAAADRPGWFFANQIRPISQQLRDGIRLLLIDAHYGVVDSRGRVRTDLGAEGTSRNRVARALGPRATAAAERLAGRLGLVPTEGEREVFLCHTLCELGAERIGSTLDELRGFLENSHSEVVVVLVESSVHAADVERAFEDADLGPYLVTLERDSPLPTLRELIGSGRRLVVLDYGDGGDSSWYQPAYVFIQDTSVRSLLTSRASCVPGRGTPQNPMLLMNHWIDRFPPPLAENHAVSGRATLLARVRECRARLGRAPNLIAVDFYDGGDVISTARELNGAGAVASSD